MAIKTHNLEAELFATKQRLESTEESLRVEREEKESMCTQKNIKIDELNEANRTIQVTYDSILQLTLDNFLQNLELKKEQKWEPASEGLQKKNKLLLAELGMKIHDI